MNKAIMKIAFNAFSENGLMGLYAAPLSAKYLSVCNWNIFANASYPITTLLRNEKLITCNTSVKSIPKGLHIYRNCNVHIRVRLL